MPHFYLDQQVSSVAGLEGNTRSRCLAAMDMDSRQWLVW